MSTISDKGVEFVALFEGFRPSPYKDPVGVWTIGYGETKGITMKTPPWTRAHAEKRLRARLNADYLPAVMAACKTAGLKPHQHQIDALTSLAYNLGPAVFDRGRTMGDAIRSKDRGRIADAFLVYDKAGDPPRALPGLTRRRKAERALYLKEPK